MLEFLKFPKEWAKIARNFRGRTQHQIKNRFISVLSKELCLKRKKISDSIKINSIVEFVYETLKSLKFKKQENDPRFYSDQKNEETEGNGANERKERRRSSHKKVFNEDLIDKFFSEHHGEHNIEGFIKFDFMSKIEPIN